MSRYYNQLWGRQKEAPVEAPPPSIPTSAVMDEGQQDEYSSADSNGSFLTHCRKLVLVKQPTAPVIFGQEEQFSAAIDCYRSLRTKLLRLMGTQGLRSLVISSANPAEGKTLTTLNLGLTFAKLQGNKTLLVDSDLRTGGLTALLGARSEQGLSDVLTGEVAAESVVMATSVENLYVVTAGQSSGRSAEAFSSEHWKEFVNWASQHFNIILVDSPPILAMADFELITSACNSMLLVVRALKTSRESLTKAVKQIDPKKFLGTVFNESGPQSKYHNYGYGYDVTRPSQ